MKTYHFKELDSTNNKAKDYPPGSVIIADVQTKGSGRLSRTWSSNIGGAWFSIVLDFNEPLRLTFIAAIAVRRAVKALCSLDCKVKWPNDIYAEDKKLAGILTQCTFGDKNRCITGIGINVNNELPKSLAEATSLKLLGYKVDKDELINEIVTEFEKALKEDFNNIIKEWKASCLYLNKNIRVETVNSSCTGRFIGISEQGFMILRTEDNELVKIVEGTVYPI